MSISNKMKFLLPVVFFLMYFVSCKKVNYDSLSGNVKFITPTQKTFQSGIADTFYISSSGDTDKGIIKYSLIGLNSTQNKIISENNSNVIVNVTAFNNYYQSDGIEAAFIISGKVVSRDTLFFKEKYNFNKESEYAFSSSSSVYLNQIGNTQPFYFPYSGTNPSYASSHSSILVNSYYYGFTIYDINSSKVIDEGSNYPLPVYASNMNYSYSFDNSCIWGIEQNYYSTGQGYFFDVNTKGNMSIPIPSTEKTSLIDAYINYSKAPYHIVYCAQMPNYTYQIKYISNTATPVSIYTSSSIDIKYVSMSPDGKWILYIDTYGGVNCYNVNTQNTKTIYGSSSYMSSSSRPIFNSSNKAIFTYNSNIYEYDPASDKLTKVADYYSSGFNAYWVSW